MPCVAIHKFSTEFIDFSLVSLTQNDKFLTTMTPYLVILSASEVSIKLKCILNSVDISPTAQYDNAGFCLEFSPYANALCSK